MYERITQQDYERIRPFAELSISDASASALSQGAIMAGGEFFMNPLVALDVEAATLYLNHLNL
ncbi:hypothetical protein KR51_00022220 [Rubidibacter lacunae KORDI 51-2]|uniref:Uncharacterized protein n=1 Tax=Rubidibacter lacunae KORDI 51-2 TaxID=582515 RepID=U5DN95_9CHRO|nr:hypothetical protein KR51_00022220 [Rubidibacter lacunae KORDI 51-2]